MLYFITVLKILGAFTRSLLLALIFYFIVFPVGMARRMMGADVLGIRKWKKDGNSVFLTQSHTFKPSDLKGC